MVAGPRIASAVRGALLRYAEQPAAEILSGHSSPGTPTERTHLAIVPLPFVGHEHADGHLLGVALVLPRSATAQQRRVVFRAVKAWEDAHPSEADEVAEVPVRAGLREEVRFVRVVEEPELTTLIPATWCRPSEYWASATPVALDRNPGNLRSGDLLEAATAYAEAEETIRRACVRIGLPAPVEVTILPAAPLAGAVKARNYGRFPSNPERTQRVLTHARLRFAEKVAGPLLLGAGRYLGLGLMKPMRVETP